MDDQEGRTCSLKIIESCCCFMEWSSSISKAIVLVKYKTKFTILKKPLVGQQTDVYVCCVVDIIVRNFLIQQAYAIICAEFVFVRHCYSSNNISKCLAKKIIKPTPLRSYTLYVASHSL